MVEVPTDAEKLTDPLWGYELGRLLLTFQISKRQYEAGARYSQLAATYARLKGLPRATVSASSLESGRGNSLAPEPDNRAIERVSDAMEAVSYALVEVGWLAESVVRRVCVADEPPQRIDLLEAALTRLADHWEIPASNRRAA
ncbi:MAG TPA: hypothetical protein PKE19_00095 [Aestuariivirga sp.]|nr:hypothetical protein [Aestuariivirga sp.]